MDEATQIVDSMMVLSQTQKGRLYLYAAILLPHLSFEQAGKLIHTVVGISELFGVDPEDMFNSIHELRKAGSVS